MQFLCDAPGRKAWFRIETEGEAMQEAEAMRHSLDYRFLHESELARRSYQPSRSLSYIERDIGLEAHLKRTMPMFLTLRDKEGTALATAIVPQNAAGETVEARVVGPDYTDAYRTEGGAIAMLEKHFGKPLRRESYNPFEISMC